MEIWLNCIDSYPEYIPNEIDKILTNKSTKHNITNIEINEDLKLEKNGKIIGLMVNISSQKEQESALSLIGSVDWILLKCDNWKMIPCENLIAAAENSGTKLAAIVENELEVPGISFALEIGVDALVVNSDLIELAIITKSQRLENKIQEPVINHESGSISLNFGTIKEISTIGVGERVCVDTTSLLQLGEGMLCGSFSNTLSLIHAESIDSEFVPTRPFRVNAGSIHSYIQMNNNTTKYLSELKSGDEVLIVNKEGMARTTKIGRIKLEKRPLIKIQWIDENNLEGNIILQQAETVRLIDHNLNPISITKLKKGMQILIHNSAQTRHLGTPIRAFSQEY